MEGFLQHPDLLCWYHDGIMLENGILVAPEDFFLSRDWEKGEYYFSWKELLDIEEDILRPHGWEIPTIEDWREIGRQFDSGLEVVQKLHLSSRGVVFCKPDGKEKVGGMGCEFYTYAAKEGNKRADKKNSHEVSICRLRTYKEDGHLIAYMNPVDGRKYAIRCISRDSKMIKLLRNLR